MPGHYGGSHSTSTNQGPAGGASTGGNYGGGGGGGFDYEGEAYGTPDTIASITSSNTGGDGVNWSPSDDIDSTYTITSFDVPPEVQEKSIGERIEDYFKGGGLLGMGLRKIGGMLNPANQYEGIEAEDDLSIGVEKGNYVSTIADWAESRGLTDDYASEDLETQMVIDKQMWDAGIRSPSFEALYAGGDASNLNNLTSSESVAINELIPQASYMVGNTTPVESQVDKWFANNQANTGLNPDYLSTYNTAKAQIANTLGMVDTSNQFGYSDTPYGGLTAQNLGTNPFNIAWMQQRGLI